jgi:GNAT superfamily N-acetyltransferase
VAELTEWTRREAGPLVDLIDAALPAEELSEDELVACLWDDPDGGITLATPAADAAVGLVLRASPTGGRRTAYYKLIAVRPDVQRGGVARRLVAAAEEWAVGQGATEIVVGASAPFYLWPGVDFRALAALCLFEAAGYRPFGAEFNMGCPTTFRAPAPAGVSLHRVLDEDAVTATVAFCAGAFPNWVAELERGIEQGGAFRAVDDATSATVGFACHSVNRLGWIGPMGTDPGTRHRGIGAALLAQLCRDIHATGRPVAEVAWVGPAGFYANTAGATVSRVFRRLARNLRP